MCDREKETVVLIKATHRYGYRFGHSYPWGIISGVEWVNNRLCFRLEFSEGVKDYWPVYDPSDPYEFKLLGIIEDRHEEACHGNQ